MSSNKPFYVGKSHAEGGIPAVNIDTAIDMYLSTKKTYKEVAAELGVTYSFVRYWVLKKGFKSKKKNPYKISEKQKQEAVNDYKDISKDLKSIAEKYGVCKRTILDWAKEKGVKPISFSERRGYNKSLRDKAKVLYFENNMNCVEISKELNVCSRCVFDWIPKEKRRTRSEIAIDLSLKGRKIGKYGGFYESKFGRIEYNSGLELQRIKQLEKNNDVVNVSRCLDVIKYDKDTRYNPDLTVIYNDGRTEVEEVKPFNFISSGRNLDKYKSAKRFYKNKKIKYIVVTQVIINGLRPSKRMVKKSRELGELNYW